MIIFPDSNQDKVEKIWQRILQDFAVMNERKGSKPKYALQTSHVLIVFNKDLVGKKKTIDRLIKMADKRMYQEKKENKSKRTKQFISNRSLLKKSNHSYQ